MEHLRVSKALNSKTPFREANGTCAPLTRGGLGFASRTNDRFLSGNRLPGVRNTTQPVASAKSLATSVLWLACEVQKRNDRIVRRCQTNSPAAASQPEEDIWERILFCLLTRA